MKYFYWRYWGTFHLIDPREDAAAPIIGVGYSGNQNYLNDPGYEKDKDHGVLPSGTYTLSGPHNEFQKGPVCFHLIPDPENKMYDRGGFMIHGDTAERRHKASDGCIVADLWVRQIFKDEDILIVI